MVHKNGNFEGGEDWIFGENEKMGLSGQVFRDRKGGDYKGVTRGGHGRFVCRVLRRHFLMAYAR